MSRRNMEQGDRYGRLVVLNPYAQGLKALCRCDCGTERLVRRGELRSADTRSCGCLSREAISARRYKHGSGYGDYRYTLWRSIRARCYRVTHKDYHYYGGRGITLWEPWHEFTRFRDDLDRLLGPRPPGMTLDRIYNDGDYAPGNLRWATRTEQARNRRDRQRTRQ